jgi:hypothetical protein
MTPRVRTSGIRIGHAALTVLLALAMGGIASAQRGGGSAAKLDLSVSPSSIMFASSDPDLVPLVSAAPITVQIRVRQNKGPWELTVLANGDLISGADTVDITNVTWTATPAPPFQGGTLSKTVAQRLAFGTGMVNPAENGSVTFRLANSWNYAAGTYSQTLVFTLSAP